MGICHMAQETQTGALYQPRGGGMGTEWEGGSKGRGYMYTYGWFLQYSYLENPTDRGAWWVAVHGVAKSQTRLSDFPFTFHFHALEKEMATHSSVLAWRIPGTGMPGGLPSVGSHGVGHDWSDLQQQQHGWFMLRFDRKQQNSVKQLSFN